MKTETWDEVHRAIEKRDSEGLRQLARAASREQTRILLNLLADIVDHDLRLRRLPPKTIKTGGSHGVRRAS